MRLLFLIAALALALAAPLAWSADINGGTAILVAKRIVGGQPTEARFFAGMVRWQPGELSEEVKRGLWYVLDAAPEVCLRKSMDGLWEELIGRAERQANTI